MRVFCAARTDVGKTRQLNEDSLLAESGVYAVADGMGGHAAGDIASALVIERLRALVPDVPLQLDAVNEFVRSINEDVRRQAAAAGTGGMGTTLVAALVVDNAGTDAIVIVNVGDSRCYVSDDEGVRMLTHDHSVVQELLDAGAISDDEARVHPDRNVVTRAIGAAEFVTPDFVMIEPAPRQRLLLCSDGVSGQIEPGQLADALSAAGDPAEAVDKLLDAVLAGRAADNATAVVLDLEWLELLNGALDITVPRGAVVDDVTGPRPAVVVAAPHAADRGPGAAEPPRSLISEVPQ